MYEVFIWVPTKGFKEIGEYGTAREAYDRACEFLPLEVRISSPDGSSYHGGTARMVGQDVDETNDLYKILDT